MKTYNVKRMYLDESVESVILLEGLTLKQARAHCKNPEASSKTAKSAEAIAHTEKYGRWFDGYDEEK